MTRTITRDRQSLTIGSIGGVDFPPTPYSSPVMTITFRAGGNAPATGLHWHETHTEYIEVVQGAALVTVGDRTAMFTAADGVITVPRYAVHQYGRADEMVEGKKEVDLVVREWTDPGDGDKEVFFRNVLSLMIDRGEDSLWGNLGMLGRMLVVLWGHDNYSVFWGGPAFMGEWMRAAVRRGVTYGVMGSVSLVGRWLFGCKSEYDEYTPPRKSG